MFGLFTSEQKRARHDAHNWLHLADKVYHFRRDQLPVQEIEALRQATHELRTRLKERADAAKLKMGMERLEGCLRRSGGAYYPKSSMVDNVEFFVVALILFLGVRAFVLQPFKIPTNSMWPSYNGMTAEVFVDEARASAAAASPGTFELAPRAKEPGPLARAARWVLFGASARRIDAPVDGELFIPVLPGYHRGLAAEVVSQRKWLVLPGQAVRYTLFVGNRAVHVTVPTDFRFEHLVRKAFFSEPDGMERAMDAARMHRRTADVTISDGISQQRRSALLLATGLRLRAGERALSFDILTGDQLFVDRVSYHFVPPKVGDGFVFRTNNIRSVERQGEYTDKYYIKRLVGTPGDTLEINPPVLIRNGGPITGAAAFEKNARRLDGYSGYTEAPADRLVILESGERLTVPERSYFAMGDNSPDSADSRYWGFVPADDVVGRPLWVYFPFTSRWGPAR